MPRFARTQSIEHAIGYGGRLLLKLTSADVRIRGVAGELAKVRATFELRAGSEEEADAVFETVRLATSAAAGELSVEEQGGSPSLSGMIGRLLGGRGDVDLSVEVEMPHAAELRLETVSGEVTAEELHGEQRYSTTSGDLYVADVGGSLRINTVSGDVVLRGNRAVAARVNAVSGDLSLTAPRIESLRAHGVSGDVEIEGELARNGEFRVETVSGDFTVGLLGAATFEVRGISTDISSDLDHRIEGRLDRRRVVIGAGQPTVVFSSMSGDLSVRRPRRLPAEASARTETTMAPEPGVGGDEQMAVLQALERGEIDVEEAARRLAGRRTDA